MSPTRPDPSHPPLGAAAVAVLRANDLGGWTRPAPRLYPHQWSWDSAFIAIGLAHVDPQRALREIETLFGAQWADGRVPHIVYNLQAPPTGYFPDPPRWACQAVTSEAPRHVHTSGIVQPPVHALAAARIGETIRWAPESPLYPRLRALYPRLLAWHRYLANHRDPHASGLLTIYHPWESGTDNSPRWDEPLANLQVGSMPPYVRRDLQHVADPSHRPSNEEYDKYLWLVESLKQSRYDDAVAHQQHPFLVKDVLMSAIFAHASAALLHLAERLDLAEGRAELQAWTQRATLGVLGQFDPPSQLALDLDVRSNRSIPVRTWAGFAPLLLPTTGVTVGASARPTASLDPAAAPDESLSSTQRQVAATLLGTDFLGAAGLRYRVVPTTAPGSPGYRPHTYWRGPSWPVADWLVWTGLRASGYTREAADLRAAALALLEQPEAHFAEYFDPFTGAPLGSADQSWTAAVTLDWLAAN